MAVLGACWRRYNNLEVLKKKRKRSVVGRISRGGGSRERRKVLEVCIFGQKGLSVLGRQTMLWWGKLRKRGRSSVEGSWAMLEIFCCIWWIGKLLLQNDGGEELERKREREGKALRNYQTFFSLVSMWW